MNAVFRRIDWLFAVFLAAAALAVCARPYAASDNDSSRLATIEAIVDYHTLAIDNTVYVPPGSVNAPPEHRPFLVRENGWDGNKHRDGTMDKLYIHGHFYSDKPMVPAVLLAGPYWVTQQLFGLRARERPDVFAYLMTLLLSGIPYVIAVVAVARTARLLGLAPRLNLLLTASFAFATVAAAYTRHLNSHSPLLAVAALVFMLLADFPRDPAAPLPWGKLLLLGLLNGFGYALEQPTGGLLLAGTGLVLLVRRPRLTTALLYGLAVLPCVVGHQSINYALAGTVRPLNQNPKYFEYEGARFGPENMTGRWNHDNFGWFLWYALRLIYSERGFLPGNVPLFLLMPGVVILVRRVRVERPEMWLALLWPVGVWLVYAALSTNYAGFSCAIRWFVPFLAAGYYLLALLLRERPDLMPDFLLLTGCGVILAAEMWWEGPWAYTWYTYWPVQVLAVLSWASWATYRLWRYHAVMMQPSLAATKHVSA
jgi:hypothetical protein